MSRACALSDLDDGKPFAVEVDDVEVVLVRQGETVHALRDECSHAELALSEGELTRKGIECWLHGSCFDLRTGEPSSPPATEPVEVFAVEIRDGDVHVDVTGEGYSGEPRRSGLCQGEGSNGQSPGRTSE